MPATTATPHAAPATPALLLPAEEACAACSVSRATWWRLHAAGRVPRPVRLNGKTLWRADELRRWVDAGCPDRKAWEAAGAPPLKNEAGRRSPNPPACPSPSSPSKGQR